MAADSLGIFGRILVDIAMPWLNVIPNLPERSSLEDYLPKTIIPKPERPPTPNDAQELPEEKDSNSVGLNGSELKELEAFSQLVISRQDELRSKAREVEEMNDFGRWWDAKVPDSEKGLLNFVSLVTKTDKKHTAREIEAYQKFYRELKEASEALRRAAREGNADAAEIMSLYDRLEEMLEQAERGKKDTNSSTLYQVHKDFIAGKGNLEGTIKKVECVALRQQLRQVTHWWKEANVQIEEMRQETKSLQESNRSIQSRLDDMTRAQQVLMQENETMAKNQRILMDQNEIMLSMLRGMFDRSSDE